MKKIVLSSFIGFSVCLTLGAVDQLPVKQQDVSPKQLESQNRQIVKLAAAEESKNLPIKIDKYTTIVDIKAQDTTMIYTFEINSGAKSDEAIIKEDHSRMEKAVTQGICRSSKRFMDAQITKIYRYISAVSKRKLFEFKVNQAVCSKLNKSY